MSKLVDQFTSKCFSLSKFSHTNVEQYVEIVHLKYEGVPVIITELLMENLTVYVSHNCKSLHYDLELSMCSDMAQGLKYLHSQRLIHNNLHGNNVLMTHNHRAKIADYLCPLLLTDVPPSSLSEYLAPETIRNNHITVKSNVFTLAVLFLEIITRHSPQPSKDASLSELEQRSNDLQSVPKSHPLLSLIQNCLSDSEIIRPSTKEVCDQLCNLIVCTERPHAMMFKLVHTTEYVSL